MGWNNFLLVLSGSSLMWFGGMLFPLIQKKGHKTIVSVLALGGILVLMFFITDLWVALERPPFKTLGETRLWYSFFLPVVGLFLYVKWDMFWALVYSMLMSILFLTINFMAPETHDQNLVPALQSIWFIPHVLVYIFAYAVLAASAIVAFRGLALHYLYKRPIPHLEQADLLVYLGFAFLTLGLVFGALWAKEAWGHYWTWDPKETWALLTWLFYLAYIHFRHHKPFLKSAHSWILTVSFIILLGCWFGVNYLQVGQNSVHTY
jgi:ABC-type transport system involved in cytochrome c biogenesis permease subunit